MHLTVARAVGRRQSCESNVSVGGHAGLLFRAFAALRIFLSQRFPAASRDRAPENTSRKAIPVSQPARSGSGNIEHLNSIVVDKFKNSLRDCSRIRRRGRIDQNVQPLQQRAESVIARCIPRARRKRRIVHSVCSNLNQRTINGMARPLLLG